mgnify:CR=1 FL=1
MPAKPNERQYRQMSVVLRSLDGGEEVQPDRREIAQLFDAHERHLQHIPEDDLNEHEHGHAQQAEDIDPVKHLVQHGERLGSLGHFHDRFSLSL